MLRISDQSSDYLVFEHDCEEKGKAVIKKIQSDELGMNWEITFYCQACEKEEEYKIEMPKK